MRSGLSWVAITRGSSSPPAHTNNDDVPPRRESNTAGERVESASTTVNSAVRTPKRACSQPRLYSRVAGMAKRRQRGRAQIQDAMKQIPLTPPSGRLRCETRGSAERLPIDGGSFSPPARGFDGVEWGWSLSWLCNKSKEKCVGRSPTTTRTRRIVVVVGPPPTGFLSI